MTDFLERTAFQFGISVEMLIYGGIAIGACALVFGLSAAIFAENPAAVRIAATNIKLREARRDRAYLKDTVATPKGLLRTLLPTRKNDQNELQRKLAQAGYHRSGALQLYMLVRVGLGIILPAVLLTLIVLAKSPSSPLPADFSSRLAGFSALGMFQILTLLVATGYFLPAAWLRGRVQERRQQIEESFPNALDLLQVSVEAGLGFDAAMTRVGNEVAQTSPALAFEFLSVQHQVQAGRPREAALADMATRTGVEMVRSFSNVVTQSMQFGTPMSEALTTYASEMRKYRELNAQEMANKLPVKMSAVLASLMLPALILVTIGPVLIRYIRFFAT